MKKLFSLTVAFALILISNLNIKAQEIEVNGDNPSSSYIRWINGQSQLALNNNYNELWFSSGSMPNFQGGIVSIVEAGLSVGFEVTQNNGATFRVYGDGTV